MITINYHLSNQPAALPLGLGALDGIRKGAAEDRREKIGGWVSCFVIEQVLSVVVVTINDRGKPQLNVAISCPKK
ncbi:MAG: hypothetical protein Q8S00_10505 [Deltaproteobacteria bacterium]|nr:hypothetical protein [Deltaproteobacteria bacterium]MDZ4343473.1 hypothetical protein [Candidatus Binatia bacterium]